MSQSWRQEINYYGKSDDSFSKYSPNESQNWKNFANMLIRSKDVTFQNLNSPPIFCRGSFKFKSCKKLLLQTTLTVLNLGTWNFSSIEVIICKNPVYCFSPISILVGKWCHKDGANFFNIRGQLLKVHSTRISKLKKVCNMLMQSKYDFLKLNFHLFVTMEYHATFGVFCAHCVLREVLFLETKIDVLTKQQFICSRTDIISSS